MQTIGRYQIKKELGRGAMGVVYLAADPRLQRDVAVKTYVLPDGVSEEMAKEFHARFLREAQAAAPLSHPGIVTIYDAGEDAALGLPYIAMEYVAGQSLRERLSGGKRPDPSWVFTMGGVLAEALHVAHRAGIIHRDIKPANILIRAEDGAAKIADFGVARLRSSELTQTGASLGSPGYMSPEQIRGAALNGRSDLFSLAIVLYEALCGKRPFQGDDLVSLAYSIAHDTQVPLSRQLPGSTAGLDAFFDRALSKDPEKRFPDGEAFKGAFLSAGRQIGVGRQERTVVDLPIIEPAPPVKTARTVLDKGAAPPPSATTVAIPPRGRLGSVMIAGAAVLLAVGLAGATYLGLSRPRILKAQDRASAAAPGASQAGGLNSAAPGAATRAAAMPQEGYARPETGVQRNEAAPLQPKPIQAPAPVPQAVRLTVPAGTEIHLALEKSVGSSSSHAGDPFTARTTAAVVIGNRVGIPAGSVVHGHVRDAVPAKKGLSDKAGSLTLSFDKVVTPSGLAVPMSATLTRVAPKSTKKNAAAIGGGAAGGALLGKVLGGSTKDAVLGSVVGAAAGTGIAAGTKGQDVVLSDGSPLTIQLDQPMVLTLRQ
jgi:predicted Ser/Thr protein kinase